MQPTLNQDDLLDRHSRAFRFWNFLFIRLAPLFSRWSLDI